MPLAQISQSALRHNLAWIKTRLGGRTKIAAVVKADAYGHQLNLVIGALAAADKFAVNTLAEAEALRDFSKNPLMLFGGILSAKELSRARNLNCEIVISDMHQFNILMTSKTPGKIWLKIETGMHRLGIGADDLKNCLSILQKNRRIKLCGCLSHFACADEKNHPLNKTQLQKFNDLAPDAYQKSMANSAAILNFPDAHFDLVRPGIMLYGISPFGKKLSALRPAMKLTAPVVSVKKINAGETVGYGAKWTAKKTTKIAVIAAGYADGYPRRLPSGAPVLLGGAICPLAGRVSMDWICVDIGDKKIKIGDRATLWGDEKLPVEVVAKYAGTIGYELVCRLGGRVRFEKSA